MGTPLMTFLDPPMIMNHFFKLKHHGTRCSVDKIHAKMKAFVRAEMMDFYANVRRDMAAPDAMVSIYI